MEVDYKQIGRRIREERTRCKLSQAELAEMADYSPQYISLIETAKKKVSLEILIQIANALGVSLDLLLAENIADVQLRYNAELFRLITDCSDFERQVILDIAFATRSSLEKNKRILHDKS